MSVAQKQAPRFRVGDWVSFNYGTRPAWAQVIEDRGALGVNRRRLYRVRVDRPEDEPLAFEMPEDDLEAATALDREAVIDYLKQGGLLSILRSNLGGGPDQPRAWLTWDGRGHVIHTFEPDRGIVGGATVPFFALLEQKVFVPKVDQVVDLLTSFRLTRDEAVQVIRSVGTAP